MEKNVTIDKNIYPLSMIFSLTRGDRMGKNHTIQIVFILGLLVALMVCTLPVCAVNGTINIAYRGSGGSYLGDTVIFDGQNSYSNVTLLRLTGPGLPAEGVPVYDINGEIGSGNTVPVNPDGSWKFSWYTGSIKGIEKLQTARYYITAFDQYNPEKSYTTSILLKKPEFYLDVSPTSASVGDYIQLTGSSEKGSTSVHIDVADSAGKIVHNYDSTVSASGYFNKGFHVDMPPGTYTLTLSSASVRNTYQKYLTINSSLPASQTPGTEGSIAIPAGTEPSSSGSVSSGAGMGSLSITSTPAGATVFLDSVMLGTTPLEQNNIVSGSHFIEVKAPGYATSAVQVHVKPGETLTISPVLLRNSSSVPLSILTVIAGIMISLVVIVSGRKCRRI
jgi:hypothetical protein